MHLPFLCLCTDFVRSCLLFEQSYMNSVILLHKMATPCWFFISLIRSVWLCVTCGKVSLIATWLWSEAQSDLGRFRQTEWLIAVGLQKVDEKRSSLSELGIRALSFKLALAQYLAGWGTIIDHILDQIGIKAKTGRGCWRRPVLIASRFDRESG